MKATFSIKKNLEKEEIIDKFKKALFDSMLKLQELAKRKSPVDTGTLRNSIILDPQMPGYEKYTLATGTGYASDIEFGTKPHVTSAENLKDWARRVLGDESLAYAVKWKIAKKGTEAQPYFRPSFYEVKNIWVKRYLNKALKK